MRIAFVVQRYGLEVCGGAELHCRWVAEHLARYAETHVITTCALDHLPWDNHYPPGDTFINGVRVHRFALDRVRQHALFDTLTRKVFGESHTYVDELEWVSMLGPHSMDLLGYIARSRADYDFFIFFTYQYFTTVFGVPIVPEKALLVPTAHDDRTLYLDVYNPVFHLPRAIIYNTDTERAMVEWRFSNHRVPGAIVGTGIELPAEVPVDEFRRRHGLGGGYILYVGRIEPAKGCAQMLEHFVRYKSERPGDLKLVLVGRPGMPLPKRDDVVSLGFVSEEEKFAAVAGSRLVLLPSEQESLSMANLEAWVMGVPVLANGYCQVLKDNCLKSNGGLYYTSYDEFAECLDLLLADAALRAKLASNGRKYFEENYSWPVIERKYLELLLEMDTGWASS